MYSLNVLCKKSISDNLFFYSMEGTILKLPEIVELKKKYRVSRNFIFIK